MDREAEKWVDTTYNQRVQGRHNDEIFTDLDMQRAYTAGKESNKIGDCHYVASGDMPSRMTPVLACYYDVDRYYILMYKDETFGWVSQDDKNCYPTPDVWMSLPAHPTRK